NLLLRTRELAMFKAVGMSQRGVKIMVALEGLFYGLTASIYGGAAGAGLSYILYRLVTDIQDFGWEFPWIYILVSFIGSTSIALLSGYMPLKKMDKNIIVEDIRAVN
ncbi:MAG: ABC transporter permease, partial [Clostridiales bacterium]|nr:ABC transporter permease [Clostridiales bacterium]